MKHKIYFLLLMFASSFWTSQSGYNTAIGQGITVQATGKTITILGQSADCFGITIKPVNPAENLDTILVQGYWFDKQEPKEDLKYKERGAATLRQLQSAKGDEPLVLPCFVRSFNGYRIAAFRVTKDEAGKEAKLVPLNTSEVLLIEKISGEQCAKLGKSYYAPLFLKPTLSVTEKAWRNKYVIAAIIAAIGVAVVGSAALYHYGYKSRKNKSKGLDTDEGGDYEPVPTYSPDEVDKFLGDMDAFFRGNIDEEDK